MIRIKIFPSLMATDLLNLENTVKSIEQSSDGIHLDVMDGLFVPNVTVGPATINKISQITEKPLFVHLMVNNPDDWINRLKLRKDDIISFHIESTTNPKEVFKNIKEKGWQSSIAVNPQTKLDKIYPFIQYTNNVLIMSVNPGFAGQQFIAEVITKVKDLVRYKKQHRLPISVAMDGGINKSNIQQLAHLGVDIFCIGSGIFKEKDYQKALEVLYKTAKS